MVDRHRIFGDYLRKAREKKGVTLSALARLLGCSVPYLSDVETGRRNPLTEKKLVQTAEFLGLQPESLKIKAAMSLGQFNLPAGSPKADRLAVKLAKAWPDLEEEDLQAIEKIIEKVSA